MKQSAGILLYRGQGQQLEVLLVHPGGPFWAKKDAHAWSIPKGEYTDAEDPWAAAQREFQEELGVAPPAGAPLDLGKIKQSNKEVIAWALQGTLDPKQVVSSVFEMEWPPRSGTMQQFPEVDQAAWFSLAIAMAKIVKGQAILLERLAEALQITLADVLPDDASSSAVEQEQPDVPEKRQTSLF